ncbi:MAG: 4'-phosphopantetheinyl transferase superfamily protein [Fibrobacter sp.]|nr:4'-phosphopantetheinyl transferase superfamily protein [Fibrobacter sp.]
MQNIPVLKRFDVETPLGVVHLVCFNKAGVNHREVIFGVLSEVSGRTVTSANLIENEENPKPTFPCLGFDVNWTHSGDICVLAYGDSGLRVGVDYEIHKARRLKIADHFFNPDEVTCIKSLSPDAAEREFFRLWCRKEALYKCVGGSFFEGALRRSMLDSRLLLEDGRLVYFCDVAEPVGETVASLCVAVSLG